MEITKITCTAYGCDICMHSIDFYRQWHLVLSQAYHFNTLKEGLQAYEYPNSLEIEKDFTNKINFTFENLAFTYNQEKYQAIWVVEVKENKIYRYYYFTKDLVRCYDGSIYMFD